MTTDDLRTRARGEAHHRCYDRAASVAFSEGALWHAAQQPTVDELAAVLQQATDDGADRTEDYARAVVEHLTKGGENDE